ncbi:magnesium chelatase domain-containing protein [Streptomyces sp. NBC_00425]|uniref:magnesium chelatase domain-containing protein n=1 Tax=Streptomyces sp. NBC_00425 TaxID=2975740 RepID=UPI002E244BCF
MTTTATTAEVREFIIVGQCQGTGYALWDIAPAPVDPARRAAVLEELGVDAMDAFGDVNTECGATAREALDNFLEEMREQSGLDDYDLTADSRTDRIAEVDAVRAHGASPRGRVEITATVTPGPDRLTITGTHPYDTGVHGRMHGGITRAGIDFPAGEVAVRIDDHRDVSGTLDLAVACAILGAAGQIDRHALDSVVCLGELCWDGFVCNVFNLRAVVQAAYDGGHRTVLVPAVQVMDVRRMGFDGLTVIGARHFTQAVDAVNKLAQQDD